MNCLSGSQQNEKSQFMSQDSNNVECLQNEQKHPDNLNASLLGSNNHELERPQHRVASDPNLANQHHSSPLT